MTAPGYALILSPALERHEGNVWTAFTVNLRSKVEDHFLNDPADRVG